MIKNQILCLSLLCSAVHLSALFKSEVLELVDGTIFSWDAVITVEKYRLKIKHFLNQLRTIDSNTYNLLDLALREKNKTFTEGELQVFSSTVQEFIEFSEAFLATLNPVKHGLEPLIQEFCEKRGRKNSMLLTWCTTEVGKERIVFHANIKTYRAI